MREFQESKLFELLQSDVISIWFSSEDIMQMDLAEDALDFIEEDMLEDKGVLSYDEDKISDMLEEFREGNIDNVKMWVANSEHGIDIEFEYEDISWGVLDTMVSWEDISNYDKERIYRALKREVQ